MTIFTEYHDVYTNKTPFFSMLHNSSNLMQQVSIGLMNLLILNQTFTANQLENKNAGDIKSRNWMHNKYVFNPFHAAGLFLLLLSLLLLMIYFNFDL